MRLLLTEDEKELSNALVAILKHNHYHLGGQWVGKTGIVRGFQAQSSG